MDSDRINFEPYEGDLMGLVADSNHLVFRWKGPGKILFSVSRRGDAASCHFASDKAGLRHLKEACDAFVCYVLWLFPWARMALAQVKKPSVGRLIEKIGFMKIIDIDGVTVYARARDGRHS